MPETKHFLVNIVRHFIFQQEKHKDILDGVERNTNILLN